MNSSFLYIRPSCSPKPRSPPQTAVRAFYERQQNWFQTSWHFKLRTLDYFYLQSILSTAKQSNHQSWMLRLRCITLYIDKRCWQWGLLIIQEIFIEVFRGLSPLSLRLQTCLPPFPCSICISYRNVNSWPILCTGPSLTTTMLRLPHLCW